MESRLAFLSMHWAYEPQRIEDENENEDEDDFQRFMERGEPYIISPG